MLIGVLIVKMKLLFKKVVSIIFIALLIGCVSQIEHDDEFSSLNESQSKMGYQNTISKRDFLSQQQEYMYKVLVADIASFQGNHTLAAKYFFEVASQVRNGQLAERATQAAWHAKQYQMAIEAARLWVTLAPNNPDAREILGQLLLQQ
jgi:Flp pilus assembly protein TadD